MANEPTQIPSPRSRANGPEAESLAGLIGRLLEDVTTLFRQEVALARAEIARSLSKAKTGVASVAAGGAVLFTALLVLLSAAVLGLATVMAAWLAALIVGVVVAAIGYGMLQAGKKKLSADELKPVLSPESLRQDKELLQRRTQ